MGDNNKTAEVDNYIGEDDNTFGDVNNCTDKADSDKDVQ
jgi:hypothetical protein